ncbi:RdgB/HAM1 family non-canonical purine NTP pyrophosphatase [Candidatus Micrarchaeota archaeon]|nr:RdgB/HAM1 family non-canonical purine NTP pyrophosphatase [Candidatus Micrarchaeota archaeon]MBD3417454.1 RdgB/HAM1 family non-canonical purine NTP pyrophosphatase [Candidatus Micrarchaeota archaeon]
MQVSFVTGNSGKFAEAEKILKHFGVNILHRDLSIDEIRSDSIEEVASASARFAHAELKEPLFVEDSGLFIPSLNGFPGAYSAWVFRKLGNEGILELAAGKEAEFRACIAYTDVSVAETFTGLVKGKVPEEIRGTGGFGYDPIFIPEKTPEVRHSGEKTFAEAPEMKEALSHRKRALEKFGKYLEKR